MINYDIKTPATDVETVSRRVEAMRQLALDLPFDDVGDEVVHLDPEACAAGYERYRNVDSETFTLLVRASFAPVAYVDANGRRGDHFVSPEELIGFWVNPAYGSESAFVGLVRYPCLPPAPWGADRQSTGGIMTIDHPGWQLCGWVKTNYASGPSVGRLASFLRAHIGLVTLLDRIGEIPGIVVTITDEADYGPGYRSTNRHDGWQEGREPIYHRHPGRYDVQALAEAVDGRDEDIAAVMAALGKASSHVDGAHLERPIPGDAGSLRDQEAARRRGVDTMLRILAGMAMRRPEGGA